MTINVPRERVGKPLIGSNHMHLVGCREGDETSMLVECNTKRFFGLTIEGRDVMAFVSECLHAVSTAVGDDDSALVVDAHLIRMFELVWLPAFGAELEQERAIDQRQYLHSIVARISDDDSMSIIIDRNASWTIELAGLVTMLADREQEREIDRRQEHQSMVVGIDDDDALVMLVDRDASREVELEIS